MALPLGYFSARRVGNTVASVRELENIRNFLIGQALTAVIGFAFSFVFIGVMCVQRVAHAESGFTIPISVKVHNAAFALIDTKTDRAKVTS